MSQRRKNILVFTALLFFTATAVAQRTASPSLRDSGLYGYTFVSIGHDSSAGTSSVMDSAVGYSFNPTFSVEAGAPFYLLTTNQTTTSSGTTSTTHSSALGDAFLRAIAHKNFEVVNYGTALTFTAPTGDTSTGVSTGRATFTWNNRLEHSFDRFTPFGEASIGNSLNSTRYQRGYTTLGAVSEFRGGAGFDLFKNVSLEASAFGDVGYGNQKVFSRSVRRSAIAGGNGAAVRHNRTFETAYLTTGTGSLVNDNGLTADLAWNPTPRVGVGMSYNHSLHFATDSVAVGVGFRLGHVAANTDKH